jgi:hypothetical protein
VANDLRKNPWYIDTAPVTYGMPTGGRVFLKEIRWENYGVSHSLVITDDDGTNLVNEQIPATGNDNFQVMRFGPFGWVNGFSVTTLTTGGNISVTITKS